MKDYWNKRFRKEGVIWSDNPSKSALAAAEKFRSYPIQDVLILGIGYGRNAKPFLESGYSVAGVEIADEAIELLTKSNLVNKIDKIYQGSVLDMPFDNKSYDAIFSFNVIHLFYESDRISIIRKCKDMLNPNGFVYFAAISEFDSGFGKGDEVERNTFSHKGKPVHYFSDSDLKMLFRDFDILDTGLIDEPEEHGELGKHVHKCRYIFAKPS